MVKSILLVSSPEAAKHASTLFADMDVRWANGKLPEGDWPNALAASTDPEWIAAICPQLAAVNCAKIRQWLVDLSQCSTFDDVKPLTGGIKPYTSSAPVQSKQPENPPSASGAASPAPAKAAQVAEPDSGDLSDFDAREPVDHDEAAEMALRSIRQATALKKHAFEDTNPPKPGEWPDPADFWGVTELPEFLPQYLPAPIEPYVTDQASRAGLDPAQVALNCYVICAALLRSGIELQMQDDSGDGRVWKEKPILWGAVVGDPSSGKGPALDIALHKFFKIASALRQKDEAAWERYDEDIKIHEKRMLKYIAEAAQPGANPGKPLPPEKPPRERLWTDDVTKEVVAKLLNENPRGKIAILKDELASWFGGFDAYGNGKSDKDRPDWLSFYESKERYIDRAMEGRSYHVQSWGGVILGGIQPEVLSRIQGKLGADGMLQRFQIIVARPKRQVPKRAADGEAVKDWHRILENLAAMQPGAQPVQLSAEAAAYMDTQAQWIADAMQAGLPDAVKAALGKWEGLFGRLMITSHCIECAAQGLAHPSPLVSLRTAEQAWGWMRWILWPHAIRFYMGELGDEFKSGRLFAEYVLARDLRRIRPHILNSKWSHYGRNYTTIQQRREFWARLEMAGWVRPLGMLDRNAQLAQEYEINTLAFDGRFADQAKQAEVAMLRYRQAMHPKMLEQQGREPGSDDE